jgi:hypothetical protein
MWRAMLMLIPLFILRAVLIGLSRRGISEIEYFRHLLLFFVPGMLTARATTLIVKLRQLQKAFREVL